MKAIAKKRKGPRVKPALASFQRGNQMLINTLVQKLGDSIRTGARVEQISRMPSNHFRLAAETFAGPTQFEAQNLVVATPTSVAASLLQTLAPPAAEALSQIEYAPVAVVSLGYRRADVAHPLNGFGFLVPRSAGLKILGTVWSSSLFPNRAPSDHVQLTSFLGGATDPATASLSDSSLIDIAHRELIPILGLKAVPVARGVTVYKRAIPQYNLGHSQRIATIQSELAKIPGLYITGNYLNSPAIGACVEHAQSVADSIRIS
jgi:oxygen-dependent protoporphyrinogen oxidase